MTIRDVANLIDVQHSTVSRALSPKKRDQISPAMVKKVEHAAKTLLDIIGGESNGPGVLRMQPRLVIRNSTAVAPR
jgi:DNA-binding LacI/PurR family transcriptional regulator